MIEVTKFKAEDVKSINRQRLDIEEGEDLTDAHFQAVAQQKDTYTLRIKGRIVACFGLVMYWEGRAEAWAIIDKDCKNEFVPLFKTIKKMIDESPVPRIEATINKTFDQGHRWIKLLGFELEAPTMKKYGVTGHDYSLYARVK